MTNAYHNLEWALGAETRPSRTPVALPKVRGGEKTPAPTMYLTTITVRAKSDNFCADCEPIALRTEVAGNAA